MLLIVWESRFRTLKLCIFQLDSILLKDIVSFLGLLFNIALQLYSRFCFWHFILSTVNWILHIISLTFFYKTCVFLFQMLHLSFRAPVSGF